MTNLGSEPIEYNGVDLNKLSPKHKAFLQEYIIDLNKSRAARDVGLSNPTAYRILAKEDAQAYLCWLNDSMRTERIASAQEVKERLTLVARGDTTEEVVTPGGDKVLKGTYVKDQVTALNLLGKYYKLFTDVQEIKKETTITVQLSDDFDEEENDED